MAGVAAIGARQRFNPLGARMNYSHPLAKDLVFCGTPYSGVDFAKSRNVSSFQGDRNAGPFGAARRALWTNANTTDMSFTTGSHTLAVATNALGTITSSSLAFRRSAYVSETSNTGWGMGGTGTDSTLYEIFRDNSLSNYNFTATDFPRHSVIVTSSDGTTKSIYHNALQAASSTSGNLLPIDSVANVNINFSSTQSAAIACAWNRVLSTNEIAMFVADPFCMLSY